MKSYNRKHIIIPKKFNLFYLFFTFCFLPVSAQEAAYGLKFNSNGYPPEMRTSLDLSPSGFLSFHEGFSMSFDVKIDFKEWHSYGYIFRMIDKNGNNIDFLLGNNDVMSFSSSIGGIVFNKSFNEIDVQPGQWLHVRLQIDVEKGELEIRVGNAVEKRKFPEIKNVKELSIVFGKNNYSKTLAVDVPDMTIKDIKIEHNNTTLYYWKLSKYIQGGVYDEIKNHFAKCENPDWIITQNEKWKKEITFTTDGNPYIAYDCDKGVVAISDDHFFYTFSPTEKQLKKQAIGRRLSYSRYANQLIYNPVDSAFYAYNILKEEDGREFAGFDTATGSWDESTAHNHYADYWHHNRYFSAKDNRLYILGGYGHLKYKKDIYLYDDSTKFWSKQALKGDNIEPRYLSGLGVISENKLLLFGGYGNQSGNQELFPHHYYDAYTIDTETMQSKKLWTLDAPEKDFVVSNSLVVDTANDCFYALCYPFTQFNTEVLLYKFSLTEPKYEIMADTILTGFKDTGSFVDLFFDDVNRKLVAVTSSSISLDTEGTISIYTLAFPPLSKTALLQPVEKRNYILWAVLVLILLVLAIVIIFVYRRKKIINNDNPKAAEIEHISGINTIKPVHRQAILLFGGFRLIDKEGNDWAAEFKPLHKNLFLLILLNTIKDSRGISFRKLKETLWFDMTEENANNNRGVALSKIRKILENIGDTQFLKQNSYWSVKFSDDVYLDYYEAMVLIRKIKESETVNPEEVIRLLSIVSEGELLPNVQIEWADAFKSEFSDELVDLFMDIIHQKKTTFSDATYIDIANAIFMHDPLNEDALKLKCSVLVKMGKNGLSKNAYTSFAKEYTACFGVDYKFSFNEIIAL